MIFFRYCLRRHPKITFLFLGLVFFLAGFVQSWVFNLQGEFSGRRMTDAIFRSVSAATDAIGPISRSSVFGALAARLSGNYGGAAVADNRSRQAEKELLETARGFSALAEQAKVNAPHRLRSDIERFALVINGRKFEPSGNGIKPVSMEEAREDAQVDKIVLLASLVEAVQELIVRLDAEVPQGHSQFLNLFREFQREVTLLAGTHVPSPSSLDERGRAIE